MTRDELLRAYRATRDLTLRLVAPLAVEDYVIQPVAEVSPPKWHLAHTTWFFETLVLAVHGARRLDGATQHLFNSYYDSIGERVPQAERGRFSRPTVAEVLAYRKSVDDQLTMLIGDCDAARFEKLAAIVTVGINHEQQHQELLLTDIKRGLFQEPIYPSYAKTEPPKKLPRHTPSSFSSFDGGMSELGHDGRGFCFDNEQPRHETYLAPFALADRLVTQGEYLEFMRDEGYSRPDLWLSDGYAAVRQNGWRAPMYWVERDGTWQRYTLYGLQPVVPEHPVAHVSYYEANAFAAWRKARLPTEPEWEHAANQSNAMADKGTLLDAMIFEPTGHALIGEVWEWTQSAYLPYPGYERPEGALGEYNGKFMIGQMVLKGGSCLTPASHIRPSYRNFFQPEKRWQMTGIRLARDP